ncbi:MAG TPA: hypothetical protein VK066_26755 [Chloroflexota bacterium]|nr:hypothetical protein [Chloroflexota bacterium]
MSGQHDPATASTGRLSNDTSDNKVMDSYTSEDATMGRPAQQTARDDMDAHPATEDGGSDRARIVPPANQGDADEVTEHLGPEAGGTVY